VDSILTLGIITMSKCHWNNVKNANSKFIPEYLDKINAIENHPMINCISINALFTAMYEKNNPDIMIDKRIVYNQRMLAMDKILIILNNIKESSK
jgi:hypothetical protein